MSDNWTPEQHKHFFLTGEEPLKPVGDAPPGKGFETIAERNAIVRAKENALRPPSEASVIEPSWLKRGLAGAGSSFANKYNGLMGIPADPEYARLSEDTVGSIGQMVPDAIGSILFPARVIPQALYGAISKFSEPAEDLYGRLKHGLQGGAESGIGQGVASGLIRGANRAAGVMTREGEAAAAARGQGLNLTAGDILDSKLLRLAEQRSFKSPSAYQADQISTLMNKEGGDPITNAVMTSYNAAQDKVSAAAKALDDMVNTGTLPGVVPRNTYGAIQEIAKRSPKTLDNIGDPQLRALVDQIAAHPSGRIPKGMTFGQLDELRKTLGPVMSKVEMQSKSGASNINTADANRWKQLYKGIMSDIDNWGSKAATEDALKAHKELSTTFKNEVLPLREHPVAGKIIDGRYERPEDLIRDLISPRNRSVIKSLYGRLDEGGKNAFDSFRLAERGTKEFVKGESSPAFTRPLVQTAIGAASMTPFIPGSGVILPWLTGTVAGEQALVHGANSALGRAIASGSPQAAKSPLANAAMYSTVRTGTQRGLDEAQR